MDLQKISNHTDQKNHAVTPRAPKMILYSIAGAVFLSFIAIAAGLAIHNDEAGLKASEVFASWIEFFKGDEAEDENETSRDSSGPSVNVRSSHLAYESEDGTYIIRKRYSESNEWYENDGLVCVYSDETGEHTELLVDGPAADFSVMDDVLYYTAWDEEAGGWTLYQRELCAGAKIKECLPEEERGRMSVNFSCYEGKIYYIHVEAELWMFCYDPKLQSNSRVSGIREGVMPYAIWNDTFYTVELWSGALWKKEPGESAQERIDLPDVGRKFYEVRICPYRDKAYLAAVAWEYENNFIVNPELYIYELNGHRVKRIVSLNLASHYSVNWQYTGGCIYFLSGDACSIRVLDLRAYMDNGNDLREYPVGGNHCLPEAHKLFDTDENIVEFEVTERFVFVHLQEEQHLIGIYDRLTGELSEEIGGRMQKMPEETGETARHAAHLALPRPDGGEQDMIFRRYGYDVSDAYGYGDSLELSIQCTDEEGEYTESLINGNVRRFLTVGDMLFYTMRRDAGSGNTALFCKNLADSRKPECLIDGGVTADFVFYDDSIWYVNRNDESRLYRYEPETGRNIRISDAEVGSYDLWNGTIYYENISDRTLCKMRLDGTGNEVITVPGHENGVWLFQLRVCPYRGKVYLACTTGLGNSLLLFAEDGSVECWIADELGSEINQGFYYEDSRLYYSTGRVHVFDVGQYIDDGGVGAPDAYDVTFFDEYHGYDEAFEVTDEFVFTKPFWYPHTIEVYDRQTGGFVEEIDCRAGQEGNRGNADGSVSRIMKLIYLGARQAEAFYFTLQYSTSNSP